MNLWALRVDVCPQGSPVPILSHVFFGDTKESADRSFRLHMEDDAFLHACFTTGTVRGVPVEVVYKLIGPDNQRKASNA